MIPDTAAKFFRRSLSPSSGEMLGAGRRRGSADLATSCLAARIAESRWADGMGGDEVLGSVLTVSAVCGVEGARACGTGGAGLSGLTGVVAGGSESVEDTDDAGDL